MFFKLYGPQRLRPLGTEMAVPGQVSRTRAQLPAATPDPLVGQHTGCYPQSHLPSKHQPSQFLEAKFGVLAGPAGKTSGEMHFPANIG
jgi:hypothetical protein